MHIIPDLINKHFPFKEFREQQFETLERIINSLSNENNHFILESPTGVGKSCIGYTAANALLEVIEEDESFGPEVLICTSTKQLQTQYVESFKNHKDVSHIWSAMNYKCELYYEKEGTEDKVYYGHPLCQKKKCSKRSNCEYLKQKEKFLKSKIGITNYHYFFNFKKLNPQILVADEAHNIEKILCDEASVLLSERQLISLSNNILRHSDSVKIIGIKKFINQIKTLSVKDNININNDIVPYVKDFIEHFKPILKSIIKEIKSKEKKIKSKDKKKVEKLSRLSKVQSSLERLLIKYLKFLKSEVEWVISERNNEKENHRVFIKPIEIYEYFYEHIGNRTNKSIFMSATICGFEQFANQLSLKNYDYLETKSIIPAENRKVYFCHDVGSINYQNKNDILPKFIKMIDRIIAYQHKKEKKIHGLIHSVSYDNAKYIKKHSKYSDHIIVPTREDLLKLNETIIKSTESRIIVSPSILEGIDLIDDLSRFQIFIKVPFNFLGDEWVKTKMNRNQKWYSREAIIKIVQGSGRSIRSEHDWAETFILDSNFSRLLSKDNELFPGWFKESIKVVHS